MTRINYAFNKRRQGDRADAPPARQSSRGSAAGRARSARTVRWNRLLDDLQLLERVSIGVLPRCESVGMTTVDYGGSGASSLSGFRFWKY
jgi:hypothetical protein